MRSSRDFRRLVDGVSAVAKEFVKRSGLLEAEKGADFGTLIGSTLKKALVSATDVSGLTKGKVREFSRPSASKGKGSSVVYFTDLPEKASSINLESRNVEVTAQTSDSVGTVQGQASEYVEMRTNDVPDNFAVSAAHGSTSGADSYKGEFKETTAVVEGSKAGLSQNIAKEIEGSQGLEKAPLQPIKKRKPRERRVPSTPFSRALGFVFALACCLISRWSYICDIYRKLYPWSHI